MRWTQVGSHNENGAGNYTLRLCFEATKHQIRVIPGLNVRAEYVDHISVIILCVFHEVLLAHKVSEVKNA
jgi:hypothetical protein